MHNYFNNNFSVRQTGCIELDEFDENYCSQKYEITGKNCVLKKYSILNYRNFVSDVFSTNNEGERKDTFTIGRDTNIFRITMPKEYRETAFDGRFQIELVYEKNIGYFGKNGNSNYIILTDKEERSSFDVNLINKRSSINITVRDKDKTRTFIKNVKIKIQDENNLVNDTYITDSFGLILISRLGKGNVKMEILEVPENL